MKAEPIPGAGGAMQLPALFADAGWSRVETLVEAGPCRRRRLSADDGTVVLHDEFPDQPGLTCGFLRRPTGAAAPLRFAVPGAYRIVSCAVGGWLLEAMDADGDSWWLPRVPMLRTFDAHGRVLSEQEAAVAAFGATDAGIEIAFDVPAEKVFNAAVWRIEPAARAICADLQGLLNVERARSYLWSSQATIGLPAELYVHLIDGWVYENAWAYPRKWKFCCDLDAYEIFLRFTGLERATGKRLYGLLRRQLLLSTLARQSADGAWYHGEWTDMNECHLRFMSGALLLIENALEEWPDAALQQSLARGVAYAAARTDSTAIGQWFLHDSVEESPASMDEMHRQTGAIVKHFGAWTPSHFLGKSPTNKMILNTHVDTLIAVDRYRRHSGDRTHDSLVESALAAARAAVALQPAPALYALVDRAIRLTMLPSAMAVRLPLPLRIVRKLANDHLLRNLWRIKHRWPRFVMPGGFIDRHLGPLQFSAKYHPVNVMDLVRLWRQFPDQSQEAVVSAAVDYVMGRDRATLRWWQELRSRRVSIGVFGEALIHLCQLSPQASYRRHLAEVLMVDADLQLGFPPSMAGGNAEIVPPGRQMPCPSAGHPALLVVNLGTREQPELLVVNPTKHAVELTWERPPDAALRWTASGSGSEARGADTMRVPARGYLRGLVSGDERIESNSLERST